MHWRLLPTLYWVGWILAFVVWETYAGEKKMGGGDVPMLTQFIVRYFRWWITMPILTWMWFHFARRYLDPTYIYWVNSR